MSGKYSFSGLPPGAYQASAQQTNYDLQWFDHKTTIETADTIKLSMEENRTGIDFDLSRGVGIYGFIDDAMTGYGIPGVEVRVASNGGYNAIVYSDYDGAYGAMLPAGSYTICILVRNGTYACRYYYNSAGPVVCEKDAEPVTIMPDAYRRADFHIQADKRDFVSTRSNLGVTMTNRGVLGEYSDTTKPSCRWTCGEGKDYLFEGDLWVGASFAGTKRLFGDMYVVNGGAWRAATNFTETSMADHQSVETYFYNADYTMSPPMVCTLVNQGLESWPNTDFVLVRYSLFVDDAGVSSVPRISDVNAGLFLDFDVSRGAQHDLVGIDTTLRMIYVYDGTGEDSTYIGVCALGPSPTRLNWWMADNDTMYRTESQKEMGLLTNVGSSVPDIQADYRVLVSTGPFELKPGDSVALPLALVVGKGKAGIRAAAQNAKEKYNSTMTEVNTRAFVGPPTAFALYQNYPNPFNPSTNIMFDLPRSSHVTVKVYNVIGQEVCTVVDDVRPAGHYSMQWSGASLASGVYFCTLQTDSFAQTRKMLLMK
jgi:hypothetical protein